MTATKSLKKLPIETAIYIDASLEGWGEGQFVKNLRQEACGLNKSRHYTLMLSNFQELNYSLGNKDIKHIRIMMDNNTAVAYINNMGGIRSDLCDDIAFNI